MLRAGDKKEDKEMGAKRKMISTGDKGKDAKSW